MQNTIDLDELIKSIDILDYISQFTEFTEKNGEYWALSPLKDEKTPSFSVRKETNTFYDFSSGVGGNVFTFVRYYFKCNAPEAIQKLKEYAGVDGEVKVCKKMEACSVAKRFQPPQRSQKSSKTAALADDYMKRYEKRVDKLAIWEREGISQGSLDRFQVYYDSFSDRLVYPVRSPDGKIVNVGGRTLDPRWKEKNLRKYTYFMPWGELKTIYGLAENRKFILEQHEIIIFEGCKSVLLADTWGIHNTGAILTSHLNPNQLQLLASLSCKVVFALDKDVNIKDDYNIKKLKQFVGVEYLYDSQNLLDAKDSPVDKGLETFLTLYKGRLVWQ